MPSDARDRSPSPHSRRVGSSLQHDRREGHHRSRSPRRRLSNSHSLAESHRYRSHSPKPRSPPAAEEARPKKKVASGFKFKEKPTGEDPGGNDRDQVTRGLERGYQDRGSLGQLQPSAQSHDPIAEKFGAGASVKDKFGDVEGAEKVGSSATSEKHGEEGKKEKKKKDKSKSTIAQPAMEMIVVYVNDRLGTRAQIMCSPSDTISMCILVAILDILLLSVSYITVPLH